MSFGFIDSNNIIPGKVCEYIQCSQINDCQRSLEDCIQHKVIEMIMQTDQLVLSKSPIHNFDYTQPSSEPTCNNCEDNDLCNGYIEPGSKKCELLLESLRSLKMVSFLNRFYLQ